jgi:hypothetical protein
MDYIKKQSIPKDGKLLAVGHSMGGILLYAMVSKCGMFHLAVSFFCFYISFLMQKFWWYSLFRRKTMCLSVTSSKATIALVQQIYFIMSKLGT